MAYHKAPNVFSTGGEGAMIPFSVILLRLGVALLLGALIGLEREHSDHSAGLRTNALIALGCALFTIISAYGFMSLLSIQRIQLDPTRIASYVIAGIGFLGGGVIFHSARGKVSGLTTAAAIWVVASVGMACGVGMLWEAVAVTVLALAILNLLLYLEPLAQRRHRSSVYSLHIELTPPASQASSKLYTICERNKAQIDKLEICHKDGSETMAVVCRVADVAALTRVIDEIKALECVQAVSAEL
ncbi:MAG: MgtC/SapB family protein [Chloroflexi bacterium]|nr:MAG: MgtC/SapB family protein [Chloroflexota bacterium]